LGISAVYASNCYLHRRNLWSALSQIQSQHNLPWSYLGDFNTILGSHEYRGNFLIHLELQCQIFKLGQILKTLFMFKLMVLFTLGLMVEEEGITLKRDYIESFVIMNGLIVAILSMFPLLPKTNLIIFLSFFTLKTLTFNTHLPLNF
jgi:hypothetical protein